MSKRYTLHHMFAHRFGDDERTTMLTRDNEHLLASLPDKVLKDAIAKGFVKEHVVSGEYAERLEAQATDTPLPEFNAEREARSDVPRSRARRRAPKE